MNDGGGRGAVQVTINRLLLKVLRERFGAVKKREKKGGKWGGGNQTVAQGKPHPKTRLLIKKKDSMNE